MFGNLFGNIEQQQAEMKARLAEIEVVGDAGDGAVKVTMTAALEAKNIAIDASKLDLSDREMIEDLVLAAVNEALEKAQIKAAAETQKLISQMMPPGMEGLLGR